MVGHENAKAGRFNIGEVDLDNALTKLASDIARDAGQVGEAEEQSLDPYPKSTFGSGQTEAEAKLFSYLEPEHERSSQFPPMAVLSARLNEFSALSQHYDVFGNDEASMSPYPKQQSKTKPDPSDAQQLEWFDKKFRELRELAARPADERAIIHLNARLAEVISRIDRLAATLPDEKTLSAIETRLSTLVATLDTASKQSAAQTDRMSDAARQVENAAGEVDRATQNIESATKTTIAELGNTVSLTATITAQQIAEAIRQIGPIRNASRVEDELRALTELSRNNGEKTAAALDRVHLTLREYLERGSGKAPTQHRKDHSQDGQKRLGVHMPIGAGAPAFTRGNKDFGAAEAEEMHLGSLTWRGNASARSASERDADDAWRRFTGRPGEPEDSQAPRQKPHSPADLGPLRGMESALRPLHTLSSAHRTFPLFGVAAVAALLLLASLALYFLHMTSLGPSQRATQIDSITATPPNASSTLPPTEQRSKDTLGNGESPATTRQKAYTRDLPSIFSATGNGGFLTKTVSTNPDSEIAALVNAVSRGDREAQYRVGTHFLDEASGQANSKSAARWLSRAAEQNHAEAQFLLASLFERGAGIASDLHQAIEWYRRAAANGHARAMHNLGVLLISGEMNGSQTEATRWLERAATTGFMHSQYNLAVLYERGLGVAKDERKALFWYSVAANTGDQSAKFDVERLRAVLPAETATLVSKEAARWRAST